MKYIKKGILPFLVILLTAFSHKVQATHIVGADMTFSCQAKEWFEIDLTVRRDCINGDPEAVFDDPAYVGIFDAYGTPLGWLGSIGSVRMELISVTNIEPAEIDCSLAGDPVCVAEARYVGKVFLPFREKGYILGYQRCCRNQTLNNILNPLETGNTSFVCITEESLNSCNSSPEFQDWPELFVCVGEEINFNSAAIDPDGDQLVYQLYTPHAGASTSTPQPIPPSGPPYDEVEYAPGFSLDNLLGSGTPLTIDSNTGVINAVPGAVGQFLVGVLVEEWRDGVMLSKTRRNFEYNVRACGGSGDFVEFTVPDIPCNFNTVQFTNTSQNLSQGFVWNFNYPSTDPAFMSTEVSPSFTFPGAGEYTVRLTKTEGTACNTGGGQEQIVTIRSGEDVTFELDGNKNVCIGRTVAFLNTSPNQNQSFIWNFNYPSTDPAFMSTEASPVFTFPAAGQYTVSLTNAEGSICNTANGEPFKIIIDIPTGEQVSFDVNGGNASCSNTVTFNNTSLNQNQSFVWNFNHPSTDPAYTSTSTSPTFTFPGPGEYRVRLTNASGDVCNAGGGFETVVTVNSSQLVPSFDHVITCENDQRILSLTNTSVENDPNFSLGTSRYDVAINGVVTSYAGPNNRLVVPNDQLVSIIMVVGSTSGCSAQANRVITPEEGPECGSVVNCPSETLVASFDHNITCESNQRILSFVGTSVENDPDFILGTSRYDVNINGVTTSYAGPNNRVVIPKGVEVSVTMVVGSTSGCSAQADRVIGTAEGPDCPSSCTLDLVTSTICPGEGIRLGGGTTNSGCTFTWVPSNTLDLTDPSSPIARPTETTTYTVTITDADGNITTQTVTVNVEGEFLELDIQDNNPGGCSSTSANVTALVFNNPENVPLTYDWSFDPDFNTVVASGQTVEVPLGSESQIIYLRAGGGNFCGSNVPGLVVIPGLRTIVTSSSPISLCDSNTGTVTVESADSNDPITVVWEPDSHITSDLNSASIELEAAAGEDFIDVTYTATSAAGCTFTETVRVDVIENAVAPNPDQEIMCGTTSIQFSLDPSYGDGDVLWDFGTINGVQVTSTEANPIIDFGMSGVFSGTLSSNTSEGCSFEPTQIATQVPEVLVIDSEQGRTVVLCAGSDTTMTFSASSNGSIIVWTDQDNNLLNAGDEVTVNSMDVSTVTGTVTDAFGCSETITFSFEDYMFDISLSGADDVTCATGPVSVLAANNDGDTNISYMWVSASGGVLSGADTDNPTIDIENAEDLVLVATNDDLGCVMEFPYPVVGSPSINASISATSTSITSGESTTLTVDTDAEGATYLWNDGNTDAVRTVSPTETTTYTVTVTDENGCTAEAQITIEVAPSICSNFFLPTAFTPNGDGNNDALFVRSDAPLQQLDLQVIDRWGNEVFRTTNQSVGWNGFRNQTGNELSPDVYAYCLKVTCNGEETILAGNVTLIR